MWCSYPIFFFFDDYIRVVDNIIILVVIILDLCNLLLLVKQRLRFILIQARFPVAVVVQMLTLMRKIRKVRIIQIIMKDWCWYQIIRKKDWCWSKFNFSVNNNITRKNYILRAGQKQAKKITEYALELTRCTMWKLFCAFQAKWKF